MSRWPNIYNDLLYKAILNKQNDSTILCYFNDTTLKTFYVNSKEPRPYLAEVQKLYDDCLFKAIQTATSPDTQKHCIHAYIRFPIWQDVTANTCHKWNTRTTA